MSRRSRYFYDVKLRHWRDTSGPIERRTMSAHKLTGERYFAGFRRTDHPAILDLDRAIRFDG